METILQNDPEKRMLSPLELKKHHVRVTYILEEILTYEVYASGEDQAEKIAELLHKEKTTPLCHNIKSIKVD